MPPSPVLIVGAGPSGLNLALALIRRNVQCRIISEADGPGEESRAMVVQARTLEFYGQYGFAGEVVEQGVVAETAHVREGGESGSREVLSISFQRNGRWPQPVSIRTRLSAGRSRTVPDRRSSRMRVVKSNGARS